jgi:hypothetical protein
MRKNRFIMIPAIFLIVSASGAAADVNEALNFTNFTHEELYVELFIYDNCCEHIYDLYVWPYETSAAYFWALTTYATYSACAYGEISGYLYGCIEGGISVPSKNIYFNDTGEPYLAGPSHLPTEVYVFENPYDGHRHSRSHYHASTGCFMDTLVFR